MKRSIRTKIILLGSITSFLLISIALLISCLVYQNKAYLQLDKNVDKSVHEIKYNLDTDSVSFLKDSIARIEEKMETSPDDPEMDTYEEKLEYYSHKFDYIYPSTGLGLSYQKAAYRNQYMDLSSDLKSAVVSSGGKAAFIGYISEEKDRIYYLADSNFVFDSKYDDKIPLADYKFYGSYRTLPDAYYDRTDLSDSEGFNCWTSIIDGYKHRVAEVFFGDGNYETDEFGAKYETGITVFIFIRYDTKEIDALVTNYLVTEIISFSGVLILLILLFGLASHFLIAKNVIKLNSSTLAFTKSMSDNQKLEIIDPNIKANDEIGTLSKSFISLEATLIDYINQVEKDTKEREKMNAELNVASRIQLEALPKASYSDKNISLNASITSAKEVGGDFYDYFYIDDNNFAIIISDVSGKGIPASLFMMRGKELIKSKLLSKMNIEDVCYNVNNELLENNAEGLFITSFIGVYNIEEDVLTFVNAGHEKPFIIGDDVIKMTTNSNFILGCMKDFKYKSEKIKLDGKKLFLYTDGLNESINDKNEEFSYDRVKEALLANRFENNDTILKNMMVKLNEFTNGLDQFDDITMVLFNSINKKLSLEYKKPTFEIIDDVVSKLEYSFSYLDRKVLSELSIIFDELLNNYISYEKRKDLIIKVDINIDDHINIELKNNGVEFNPLNKNEKYLSSEADISGIGGFGLTIVKNMVDDISYERKNNFNVLRMKKKI